MKDTKQDMFLAYFAHHGCPSVYKDVRIRTHLQMGWYQVNLHWPTFSKFLRRNLAAAIRILN